MWSILKVRYLILPMQGLQNQMFRVTISSLNYVDDYLQEKNE